MKKPKYNFGAEFVAKQNRLNRLRELRKLVIFGPVRIIVRKWRNDGK
jgi:hypothetical protein